MVKRRHSNTFSNIDNEAVKMLKLMEDTVAIDSNGKPAPYNDLYEVSLKEHYSGVLGSSAERFLVYWVGYGDDEKTIEYRCNLIEGCSILLEHSDVTYWHRNPIMTQL
ncbi:hypothetical protein SNEBB_010783 [Seison nebaliae]|nr:hypothetical protein SNEBB_010783 [Seison nebaliae]